MQLQGSALGPWAQQWQMKAFMILTWKNNVGGHNKMAFPTRWG